MSKKELLIRELDQLPESILDELGNYLHYIQFRRAHEEKECQKASLSWAESVFSEWLEPTEEEAWAHFNPPISS